MGKLTYNTPQYFLPGSGASYSNYLRTFNVATEAQLLTAIRQCAGFNIFNQAGYSYKINLTAAIELTANLVIPNTPGMRATVFACDYIQQDITAVNTATNGQYRFTLASTANTNYFAAGNIIAGFATGGIRPEGMSGAFPILSIVSGTVVAVQANYNDVAYVRGTGKTQPSGGVFGTYKIYRGRLQMSDTGFGVIVDVGGAFNFENFAIASSGPVFFVRPAANVVGQELAMTNPLGLLGTADFVQNDFLFQWPPVGQPLGISIKQVYNGNCQEGVGIVTGGTAGIEKAYISGCDDAAVFSINGTILVIETLNVSGATFGSESGVFGNIGITNGAIYSCNFGAYSEFGGNQYLRVQAATPFIVLAQNTANYNIAVNTIAADGSRIYVTP